MAVKTILLPWQQPQTHRLGVQQLLGDTFMSIHVFIHLFSTLHLLLYHQIIPCVYAPSLRPFGHLMFFICLMYTYLCKYIYI